MNARTTLLGLMLAGLAPGMCAAVPDYAHLVIRLKHERPIAQLQGSGLERDDSLASLRQIAPNLRPLVPASASRSLEAIQALQRHRLTRYYLIDTHLMSQEQAQGLALQLQQSPLLDSVEFEPRVDAMHDDSAAAISQIASPRIPDYTPRQHYLLGQAAVAPYRIGGVNAVRARNVPGAKGESMRVISSEVDHWAYQHSDLPEPSLELSVDAITGAHDTASVGIIASRENAFGTTGIVPRAQLWYLQWGTERLLQIAQHLNAGDVLQLGVHYNYSPIPEAGCHTDCFMPLEYFDPVRDTIAYLVEELGVHVILPSGNGGIDLDHTHFKGYFQRDRFDSGAIYVGSVDPKTGLRSGFADYGQRVDLFSWGANVTSTTWSRSNPTSAYTHTFNGTSASNPIIAGAVAALQGVARAHGLGNIAPKTLRRYLVSTGYPQINGNRSEIGVQPDLHEAIRKMLDDAAGQPPTGRLALPESVKSGETFTAHVYAQSPTNQPLMYEWHAPGFDPTTGNEPTLALTAPTVNKDDVTSVAVDVSDGNHSITFKESLTIQAPSQGGDCGAIPPWDAAKTYQTYAEAVAYLGKVYRQNFYNLNKPPDTHSADHGKEWLTGVACP